MSDQLSRLRLLRDLVLVKPVVLQSGGVVILPDTAEGLSAFESGDYRDTFEAVVVKTGPGDILLHGRCDGCGTTRDLIPFSRLDTRHAGDSFGICKCGGTRWTLTGQERAPMNVAVGDRVLCPRRVGSEMVLDGERYLCFHAEQFAYAVIEEAA